MDNTTRIEPSHERQQRWNAERQRILAERAMVRRRAEETGQTMVFLLPEPPDTPPSWWEQRDDTGPPRIEHSHRAGGDPNTITLPYGPLGVPPVANAGEPTPEEIFRKEGLKLRVKRLLGVDLSV